MKNLRIEIKWSIILIASLLLWMIIEKLSGLHDVHIDMHQSITMLYYIIFIILYVLALRDKKKNFYNGKINYKRAFVSGLIISLIVALFSPISQWIISNVITPDYFENVIKYSVETGYFDSIEKAEAQFNYRNYAIQSAIGSLLIGVITSAIVAIFMKSKK